MIESESQQKSVWYPSQQEIFEAVQRDRDKFRQSEAEWIHKYNLMQRELNVVKNSHTRLVTDLITADRTIERLKQENTHAWRLYRELLDDRDGIAADRDLALDEWGRAESLVADLAARNDSQWHRLLERDRRLGRYQIMAGVSLIVWLVTVAILL